MKRKKPEDAIWYGWNEFEEFADKNGYGTMTDDWDAWWKCWKQAYIAAMNDDWDAWWKCWKQAYIAAMNEQ